MGTPKTNGSNSFKPLGQSGRVSYAVTNDNELLIRVPFNDAAVASAPMSKSGKNKLVGSTNGFVYGLPEAPLLGVSINITSKVAT